MCGIFGYIGPQSAGQVVLDGLRRLEYRGYDSAGLGLLTEAGSLQVAKTSGKLDQLVATLEGVLPDARTGIGHTRWATHGAATDRNAHPHLDPSGEIAIVHNGIVENAGALRRGCDERGCSYRSDTDSEVIAHLMGDAVANGVDLLEALRQTVVALDGAQAIVAIHAQEPGRLVAARVGNAGGVVVGYGDAERFVASDVAALLPLTRHHVFLEPGELVDLGADRADFFDMDGHALEKTVEIHPAEHVAISKGRYSHFMMKEIQEQPESALDAIRGRYLPEFGEVRLDELPFDIERVRGFRQALLVGMGTSMHSAAVGRQFIERFARIPTEVENASELRYRSRPLDRDTLVVSVTQSGETADTLAAMEEARRSGCAQIAICNVAGSQATRLADATLLLRAGPEIAVASTKTFVNSAIVLHALGLQLGRLRGTLDRSEESGQVAATLALPAALGRALALRPHVERIAERYARFEHFLFLGRGPMYPLALEGALKLKEVSYIHAEGYSAGEMKHGPIALIDREMPVVALAADPALRDKMRSNIEQVKARHGLVIAVVAHGDHDLDALADDVIELPAVDPRLAPIVAAIPMQLFAYAVATERGLDVDQPRNLAKTVTVE